ncbi:MAG: hypothetical protein R2748_01965 [Bryobacterales bacterium]
MTFRTYTVYENYEALEMFLYSPGLEAMRKMGDWSGPESRSLQWISESREIDWADAERRLAETPTYFEKQARTSTSGFALVRFIRGCAGSRGRPDRIDAFDRRLELVARQMPHESQQSGEGRDAAGPAPMTRGET